MKKQRSLLKRVGIDILGVLLIFGSILFGWLPGPGGIPLFLGGLSLLATNHTWAKKILDEAKIRGANFSNIVFRDNRALIIIYDILAAVLLVIAGLIFAKTTGSLFNGLAIIIVFIGVALFLGNKHRMNKFNTRIKKIIKKNQ